MITWEEWLRRWGLYDPEIAQALEMLGLRPEYYKNPLQLAADLRKILELPKKKVVTLSAQPVTLVWDEIKDFFSWISEQLKKLFGKLWERPYRDLILMAIGGGITWLAPGYFKLIGVGLIGYSIYDLVTNVYKEELRGFSAGFLVGAFLMSPLGREVISKTFELLKEAAKGE